MNEFNQEISINILNRCNQSSEHKICVKPKIRHADSQKKKQKREETFRKIIKANARAKRDIAL